MNTMIRILILLFTISYTGYAQSSVETTTVHEQKARMTTKQRIQLKPFESLSVIDTDENRSYVFRNGKWETEFSDTEIMAAQKHQQAIKNTNASWKEFDEMSRPVDANTSKNPALSTNSTTTAVGAPFYYQATDAKEFYQNGANIKIPDGKQICFLKVYFENTPESNDVSLDGSKAHKILSDKVVSFRNFESGLASISFEQNGIKRISTGNNEILGILLAYTD